VLKSFDTNLKINHNKLRAQLLNFTCNLIVIKTLRVQNLFVNLKKKANKSKNEA